MIEFVQCERQKGKMIQHRAESRKGKNVENSADVMIVSLGITQDGT